MSLPVASTDFELARLAERTQPWQTDELCHVGTAACCYSFVGGVLVVRLPGGRCATVAELRERGHVVVLPARLRRGAES